MVEVVVVIEGDTNAVLTDTAAELVVDDVSGEVALSVTVAQ